MTQMVYRPETEDFFFEEKELIKTPFKHIKCDALVIDEEDTELYEQNGWFSDPNKMLEEQEEQEE